MFRITAPGGNATTKVGSFGVSAGERKEVHYTLDNVWLAGYDRANNYRGVAWSCLDTSPYVPFLHCRNIPCPIGVVSWGGGMLDFDNCTIGCLALYGTTGVTKHFITLDKCRLASYSNTATIGKLILWNGVSYTDARIFARDCILTPAETSTGTQISNTNYIQSDLGLFTGTSANIYIKDMILDYAYWGWEKTMPSFTNRTY